MKERNTVKEFVGQDFYWEIKWRSRCLRGAAHSSDEKKGCVTTQPRDEWWVRTESNCRHRDFQSETLVRRFSTSFNVLYILHLQKHLLVTLGFVSLF